MTTPNDGSLEERYQNTIVRIQEAEARFHRSPGAVSLLAVSKTRSSEEISRLASLGQRHFGESYLQEALNKMAQLKPLGLEWHFIGPIQSNKSRAIATNFDWVHSVDRLKIAHRLSEQRPPSLPNLNICLQVNISADEAKSGCTPEQLPELAGEIATLPRLTLRGLMAIPNQEGRLERQRIPFAQLWQLWHRLCSDYRTVDTLSMGMSGDLEAAIAEGSTTVRIGTALFGPRRPG